LQQNWSKLAVLLLSSSQLMPEIVANCLKMVWHNAKLF